MNNISNVSWSNENNQQSILWHVYKIYNSWQLIIGCYGPKARCNVLNKIVVLCAILKVDIHLI